MHNTLHFLLFLFRGWMWCNTRRHAGADGVVNKAPLVALNAAGRALGSELLSDSDGQPVFSYALWVRTIWELINVEAEWDGAWNLSKLHEVLAHQSCYFQCTELNLPGNYFLTGFLKLEKRLIKSLFWNWLRGALLRRIFYSLSDGVGRILCLW